MQFFDTFLTCYGWEGIALAGAMLAMFGVQLYYYIFVYGRIPGYKNNRRPAVLEADPQVSVVIPLFSEDYSFVEERLPLILAQNYPDFEVVIVYVGHDSDFYEELVRLKQSFPQIVTTKIHLDPRFPISRKMALNVGIKSAHYECMVFTSTDAVPQTDRWLALMAKGFTRGEIVVGYCDVERRKGFANYMMRAWRMMHSAATLTAISSGVSAAMSRPMGICTASIASCDIPAFSMSSRPVAIFRRDPMSPMYAKGRRSTCSRRA